MNLARVRFGLGLASFAAGLQLSAAHPLGASPATALFVAVCALLCWQARWALVALPLGLPWLDFSPWSGWQVIDEFDLLLLAVLAAGYLRWPGDGAARPRWRLPLLLAAVFALSLIGVSQSPQAAVSPWFADYSSPLNALRVGKTLLWVALLAPLVRQAASAAAGSVVAARFFAACLAGAGVVVAAVLWERGFFPGLFDFLTPYRTVALFWEMHLGGAALDAYLVLLAPLLVWAWRATPAPTSRLALAAFIVGFVYAVLTTFSRGVYGATSGALLMIALWSAWRRRQSGRRCVGGTFAGVVVLTLVAGEVVLVLAGGSFMGQRLATSQRDFGGRLQHWRDGLSLLRTPVDWALGIGLGRLPAELATNPRGPARPGAVAWRSEAGRATLLLSGPDARRGAALGGLYALTQRVELTPGQPYRVGVDLRSAGRGELLVQLCAQHLLYPASCQSRRLAVAAGGWRRVETVVTGPAFAGAAWLGAGHGVFALSLPTPGAVVEVGALHLDSGGDELLHNGQFSLPAARWWPAARSYFLPWHIDNLYLEILIETGLLGLAAFLAVVVVLLRRLIFAVARGEIAAAYYLASLAGLLALGLVVSVLDMPRVATLCGLFMLWAWHGTRPAGYGDDPRR